MSNYTVKVEASFEADTEAEARRLFWEWLDEQHGHDADSVLDVDVERELPLVREGTLFSALAVMLSIVGVILLIIGGLIYG